MHRTGVFYALGAYLLWGFLPLYWKALSDVPALEILAHRMSWSLLFVLALLAIKYRKRYSFKVQKRAALLFLLSATLLSVNWLLYIWAVQSGFVIETSLGYFINPLVNVALGSLFLGERLRRGQTIAVMIATFSVVLQTCLLGRLPWIALTLGFSFAFYGLLRKKASLASLEGLAVETAWLFPPACAYLIWLECQSDGAFLHGEPTHSVLLSLAGIATGLPLLWFACAARRITLTTVGFLQYLAPTVQFTLGVCVFHEPLGWQRAMTFGLIMVAVSVYSIEAFFHHKKRIT